MTATPAPDTDPDPAILDRARAVIAAALDEVGPQLLGPPSELTIEAKSDGTPVSNADIEVDDHLRSAIVAAFDSHGVLSEERGTRSPLTAWTWVIDPIDGTSNFINGLPYWCISVALLHHGEPVLGVIDAPVLGRRYTALIGRGAEREDRCHDGTVGPARRLAVRDPVPWRDPSNGHVPVLLATGAARRARDAGLALNPRVMGSTALDLALVAEGVAAASIARIPKVWDVAAGALLVREAGGAVVTLDDVPLLPLAVDQEQAGRSALTAAGPDAAYVEELTRALLTARPRKAGRGRR